MTRQMFFHKRRISQDEEIQMVEITIQPPTNPEGAIIDEQSHIETVTQNELEENETQLKEAGEVGWAKMIFDFLKIIILGLGFFCWDIISKNYKVLFVCCSKIGYVKSN